MDFEDAIKTIETYYGELWNWLSASVSILKTEVRKSYS